MRPNQVADLWGQSMAYDWARRQQADRARDALNLECTSSLDRAPLSTQAAAA